MGDTCAIDWTCEHCEARRFTCVDCGEECIVDHDSQSELCERCFGNQPGQFGRNRVPRPRSIDHAKRLIAMGEWYLKQLKEKR